MDDRVLIERYLSGEESAMEEIMVKYQKSVYGLAYRLTWDKEESKDITQQTFTQVIKNLAKFRKESLFKTWLYKIAINLSLNYKEKQPFKKSAFRGSRKTTACNCIKDVSRIELSRSGGCNGYF
jgi:RNA polymerase sigma-70 factor (ECF subfamily)